MDKYWGILCVCVLLSPSPWGFSELWGGGVPTLDIDQSGPRLHPLLLHRLLIEPTPPSLPDVQFPSGGAAHFCPAAPDNRRVSARDHPPNRASPVSVPAYQNNFSRLPLTHHFHSLIPPSWSRPRHACKIPVSTTPMLPPKSLLTWPSFVIQMPPASTMAPKAPPPS